MLCNFIVRQAFKRSQRVCFSTTCIRKVYLLSNFSCDSLTFFLFYKLLVRYVALSLEITRYRRFPKMRLIRNLDFLSHWDIKGSSQGRNICCLTLHLCHHKNRCSYSLTWHISSVTKVSVNKAALLCSVEGGCGQPRAAHTLQPPWVGGSRDLKGPILNTLGISAQDQAPEPPKHLPSFSYL